jgi:hypothetical protein
MIFLLGGILGLILFLVLFEWALILLSSIEGAQFIAGAITLPRSFSMILIVVLVAVGIGVQSSMRRKSRR